MDGTPTCPASNSKTQHGDRSQEQAPGSGAFGSPVFLDGESRARYEELLARVTADVVPRDVIEEIWVQDIVDLVWDARRFFALRLRACSRLNWL